MLLHGPPPQRGAIQVRNEQGSPSHTMRVQRPGGDQAEPKQGPHTRIAGTQVSDVAAIQGGHSGKQAHLLARNRALH